MESNKQIKPNIKSLNIHLITRIPGEQYIEYNPSMNLMNSGNNKYVYITTNVKLDKNIINSVPPSIRLLQFFNEKLFKSLLKLHPNTQETSGAEQYNINLILNMLFPSGEIITIDNQEYEIVDYTWDKTPEKNIIILSKEEKEKIVEKLEREYRVSSYRLLDYEKRKKFDKDYNKALEDERNKKRKSVEYRFVNIDVSLDLSKVSKNKEEGISKFKSPIPKTGCMNKWNNVLKSYADLRGTTFFKKRLKDKPSYTLLPDSYKGGRTRKSSRKTRKTRKTKKVNRKLFKDFIHINIT